MLTDADTERCAEAMIRHHGIGAEVRAVRHAEIALQDGAEAIHSIWMKVAERIRELQNREPTKD